MSHEQNTLFGKEIEPFKTNPRAGELNRNLQKQTPLQKSYRLRMQGICNYLVRGTKMSKKPAELTEHSQKKKKIRIT